MKRNWTILLAILVVLAIVTYVVMRQPGEVSSTGSSGKFLVTYDSAAVDKLEITSSAGSVTLEKDGTTWMLSSPLRYRADGATVASAVGQGKNLEISTVVSSNPEKQKVFQVDSTGTLVTVYEKGALRAAFHIGKMGPSYSETYVRARGSNDVYLASGMLGSTFGRQVKDWRDKTVFKTDQSIIRSVMYRYDDTTFTVALKDSVWRIGTESPVESTVKNVLTALSNLQADEFIDSTLSMTQKPAALIEVEGTQLRFYSMDASKYSVQTSRSPQWFEIQGWKAMQILKRKKDFLPVKS
jgi:hypothetical protein